MQVFRTYFKLLKSQMVSIIIYGVTFLIITIIISIAILRDKGEDFSIKEVPVYVINQDEPNEFINGFLDYLDQYVNYVALEDSDEARKDALFYRKVLYILTIPEGFTESFLAGEKTELIKEAVPGDASIVSVDSAINNYLNKTKIYLNHAPDIKPEELHANIKENLKENTEVAFDITYGDEDYNSNLFNRNYYNYLAYILLVCLIKGVSSVMVSFHNLDIQRRQNASPLSLESTNLQLILANFVFVIVYLGIFIVAGYVCNPYRMINRNLLLFILNSIVFTIMALSISYLIGITVKSKNAVSALSTVLSLSLSFLCGVFVDQQYLGKAVIKVASFTPVYWYVRANNAIDAIVKFSPKNLTEIIICMGIEIGFAIALFAIALVVSKRKRQQA